MVNFHPSPADQFSAAVDSFPVDARELDPDEAVAVLCDYERRNRLLRPIVRRVLSKLVGRPYTGTDDERRALVRDIPLVGLRPTIRTIKT